jgi:hypothetical protein
MSADLRVCRGNLRAALAKNPHITQTLRMR